MGGALNALPSYASVSSLVRLEEALLYVLLSFGLLHSFRMSTTGKARGYLTIGYPTKVIVAFSTKVIADRPPK